MSRLDYAAMAACYGMVGSLGWAIFTGNLWPLGITLAYTGGLIGYELAKRKPQ